MREFKSGSDRISEDPVDWRWKASGWFIVGLSNTFYAYYILLFGISKGAATTNAWLLSFLTSLVQDPLLNSPLLILFFHVLMPLYIAEKVRRHCALQCKTLSCIRRYNIL
jgi:hypothetical protein